MGYEIIFSIISYLHIRSLFELSFFFKIANHGNIPNPRYGIIFRVVEYCHFYCVTVLSVFWSSLNQSVSLSFKLPAGCSVRLQNFLAIKTFTRCAVEDEPMRRKGLVRKNISMERIYCRKFVT